MALTDNNTTERPLIVVSNDDGYEAGGINSLAEWLRTYADVVVVAPDSPRSGASMSISSHTPVRCRHIASDAASKERGSLEVWSCSGTPDDCVKMAFERLTPRTPTLVAGGINHGENCAVNAHYSGTMAVALEGCIKGIPSIAFSYGDSKADADFTPMRPYVERIVRKILDEGLPKGVCLNVNMPSESEIKGIRTCRMGMGEWRNEWEERTHPHGWQYYWIAGYYDPSDGDDEATDTWAYRNGYVSVTPIQLDLTAYEVLKSLSF